MVYQVNDMQTKTKQGKTMLEKANSIMATVSYNHIPKRCRKSQFNVLTVYGEDKDTARSNAITEAKKILETSKSVKFAKTIKFQKAEVKEINGKTTIKSFIMFDINSETEDFIL